MTLDFLARALVQALAAHAVVTTAVAGGVLLVWPRLVRSEGASRRRVRRLFFLRLAPTGAALVLAWIGVLLPYALWEPRGGVERAGPVALGLAGLGAALLASSVWRLARAAWDTRRVHAGLRDAAVGPLGSLPLPAQVVDAAFPVVVLVGMVRARLFVARTVLAACTEAELQTVVAHELAHARARDNLRRLTLTAAPDILAWIPSGAAMARAWSLTAELAADEDAARSRGDRLHLASALIKVARLAAFPGGPLPASALYRGEPISDRIHRLVDPPADRDATGSRWPARAAIAAGAVSAPAWLPGVHAAVEALLRVGLR